MAPRVQTFRISEKAKADFTGRYRILIDRQLLEDRLNDLCLAQSNKPWRNRSRCLIDPIALKASGANGGPMSIVICANCAASGYRSSDDIGLLPFTVTHEAGFISWAVTAPRDGAQDGDGSPLKATFVFDRAQYLRELEKIQP